MILKINTPWWSAWKTFGWERGTWGIGLDKKKIDQCVLDNDSLKVEIKGKTYCLDPVKVWDYCCLNNTKFMTKYGNSLYVIPNSFLKENDEEND